MTVDEYLKLNVKAQVTLDNLPLLLLSQCMKNRTQLLTSLAEDGLSPSFGHEYYVVLAVPF